MNCKICGKQLPNGQKVCPYCGANNGNSTAKRRRSKKGRARQSVATIIAIVIALILLGLVIFGIVKMVQKLTTSEYHPKTSTAEGTEDEEADSSEDEKSMDAVDDAESADNTSEQENVSEENVPAQEEESKESSETVNVPSEGTAGEVQPEEQVEEEVQIPETEETKTEETVVSTKTYSLTLSKTDTHAKLNHYREIDYSIDPEFESGVKIVSVDWVSSDTSIVRVEVVDNTCRAWGEKSGNAVVTCTITLNNGQKLTAECKVAVGDSSSESESSASSLGNSDYILKDATTHRYTKDELSGLSKNDLMLARNEIYARHGYIFKDTELQSYFESKSWYHGTDTVETFDFTQLSDIERDNVSTISSLEKTK